MSGRLDGPMLVLRQGDLFAPAPLGRSDLLVAGGQITAIAPTLPTVGLPVDALDCAGCFVVPGLIDAHTHLSGGGGEGGAHTRVPALQLTELTRHGVTTAIGLLGTDTTTRSIAELLAVARGLDHLGITALAYTGGYAVPPVTLTGSVRGDLVHVDRIVAVGELALSDHRSSQPTFDELARIASDCHVAGMMTGKAGLLHVHLGDGPRGLELLRRLRAETELPARVLHPTHCNRNRALWAEALDWGRSGGFVDVTAFPEDPDDPGLTAADALRAWHDAGLPWERITLTSDGGGCLPTFDADGVLQHMDVGSAVGLLDTIRVLVAGGLPLAQALAPCTASVAALFRLHGKGRLAVGADADVLVLGADLRVRHVVARGRLLVRDGAPVARGPFEVGR